MNVPISSRPVIVGTAGHIDHGKTALVGRLTGIDTDRLKEEKERGISIDLGFAHHTLPSGRRVGIVDVPGHERFVKNMLAGATGVDVVLLVVAADEGVMPQTREHLAIVDLLGVTRGVVALTKSDLVDAELLPVVAEEVAALLRPTRLAGAPTVPVSSITGEGFEALARALDEAAAMVTARDALGPARLPVDRVFSIEGIGTVVTGTLWSGSVRVGDGLLLLPAGRAARVRRVEVHDEPVEAAAAGQRTALALHGVGREEIARGDWLVTPGRFGATAMLDARVRLLGTALKPLATRTRVRIHLGASEVLGRVVLLEGDALPPGGDALAQLRLEGPVVAVPRDRLVLRSYSPAVTIGGAQVLDPTPAKHARIREEERRFLIALEGGSAAERILALAHARGLEGVGESEIATRLGVHLEEIAGVAKGLKRLADGRLLTADAWRAAREAVETAVRRAAEGDRLRDGLPKGELKSRLSRTLETAVFDGALESLLEERRLVARGDRIAVPDAPPALSPGQEKAVATLEGALEAGGLTPPELSEIARGLAAGTRIHDLARYLVEQGRIVKVTSELYYPCARWAEIERAVRAHLSGAPSLSMADFKRLVPVSRKYAIPILEHLDRLGRTRRQGDARVAGPRPVADPQAARP